MNSLHQAVNLQQIDNIVIHDSVARMSLANKKIPRRREGLTAQRGGREPMVADQLKVSPLGR